jgi:protein TonB
MIKDTTFEKALAISITLHILILTPWPGLRFLRPKVYSSQKVWPEIVVYNYKIKEDVLKVENLPQEKAESQNKPVLNSKLSQEKKSPRTVERKNTDIKAQKIEVHPGPQNSINEQREVKKDEIVSLSGDLKTESISQAVLDYYRAIREEIKKRAYYYKPHVQGKGIVTVLFTLSRDGVLRELAIDDKSSTSQEVFQQAALKSVKYASPFPPFPPELKNDYITFSITIEFNLRGRW